MSEKGYINYYDILGLQNDANPGEVRKVYRRKMKNLVGEIAQAQITEDRRSYFLLEMAKLNAAAYILRDREKRETYWNQRAELIDIEARWREADRASSEESDALRREFDSKIPYFLSKYVEESMLEAGRVRELAEASHWDIAHERHAARILRHYRHGLHHDILERLPYYEVTRPQIDWDERARTVAALISGAVS